MTTRVIAWTVAFLIVGFSVAETTLAMVPKTASYVPERVDRITGRVSGSVQEWRGPGEYQAAEMSITALFGLIGLAVGRAEEQRRK